MVKNLDVEQMRALLAAARTGSISRAAATLGRTQPAVSQQLRRLEALVGLRLLERTSRGVSLTPGGDIVAAYADRVLSLMDEMRDQVHRQPPSGRWRVGMIEDLAGSRLTAALSDFGAVHPQCEVDVLVADSRTLADRLRRGTLDLAIGEPELMGGRPQRRAEPTLAWVVSRRTVDIPSPLPLVLFHGPCQWRRAMLEAIDASKRPWRSAFESSSLVAIQAAVAAGWGVSALLPENVTPGMRVLKKVEWSSAAPRIELGLYRKVGTERDGALDHLERLLWRVSPMQ